MAQKPRENKATEGVRRYPSGGVPSRKRRWWRLLRGTWWRSAGTGLTAGAGGMAAGVPGDRSAGTETPGPRPWRTGADPDPGEAGRVDDATGACERTPGKKGVRGRAGEALEARTRVSPGTGRLYPLTMICEVWRVGRSIRGPRSRRERRAGRAEEARTEDEAERRGVGGGDPTGAEGER